MRSSVYYGARAMARELNRQRNAHQRSMEAAARRAEREEIYEEGYEEEQEQNNLMIQKRDIYHEFADLFMLNDTFFYFDSLKEEYKKEDFKFKSIPKYVDRAKDIEVPKEKKIEKLLPFLKDKRINLENKKKEQEKIDKKEYEKELDKYNIDKEKAYQDYLENEKIKEDNIKVKNKEIDRLANSYMNKEKQGIDFFYKSLIASYYDNYIHDPFDEINLAYDDKEEKLVVEVKVKDVNDFIGYSHCKYIKSRMELEYYYYNDTGIKNELSDLLPKFALGFANMFLKHDYNDSIKTIVVNMIYNNTYLVSLKINKANFFLLNLNNLGDLNKVYKENMQIFKTLHSLIKVYDYIK